VSTPREILDQLEALGIEPTGVADDSRQVQPGDLFLAYPGDLADGRRYIADAIERGAVAVLWQPGNDFVWNSALTVANLPIEALRPLAGPLAHAVYGHPSEGLSLIAITGTNGKTTISQCIAQSHPKACAIIGTLGAGFPDALIETGFTTPEATTLMRYLAGFRRAGAAARANVPRHRLRCRQIAVRGGHSARSCWPRAQSAAVQAAEYVEQRRGDG